nr:MAG TPA: hypothetical protein [Bacteriophage sp.]
MKKGKLRHDRHHRPSLRLRAKNARILAVTPKGTRIRRAIRPRV